jgi:hypothetical protein
MAGVIAAGGVGIGSAGLLGWMSFGIPSTLALGGIGVGYVLAGVALYRVRPPVPVWTLVGALALAALEGINVAVEHLLPMHWPVAVVGGGSLAALVLAASLSGVLAARSGYPTSAALAGVLVVGTGLLVSSTLISGGAVVARLLAGPSRNAALAVTLGNAQLHVLVPPVGAAGVAAVAAVTARRVERWGREAQVGISAVAAAVLAAGVVMIAHGTHLPRQARPPWIAPGMVVSAVALVVLPCAVYRRPAAVVMPN